MRNGLNLKFCWREALQVCQGRALCRGGGGGSATLRGEYKSDVSQLWVEV